jgi:hypothetical protein
MYSSAEETLQKWTKSYSKMYSSSNFVEFESMEFFAEEFCQNEELFRRRREINSNKKYC